jgi:hypothetical protein
LYGRRQRQRAVYLCSKYMRSGGKNCSYNAVDAEATLSFVLSVLQQRVQVCGGREALRARLMQLAAAESTPQASPLRNELELAEQRLAVLQVELKTIRRNLARAGDDDTIFAAIKAEYRDKEAEVERARQLVERLQARTTKEPAATPEQEVEAALALFTEIERVTSDPSARAEVPQLLRKLNLHLWLTFGETQKGGQSVRAVRSGILTLGSGPQPRPQLQGGGDHPPDAGEDGEDPGSSPVGKGQLPTAMYDARHQESGGFTIGNTGEPEA